MTAVYALHGHLPQYLRCACGKMVSILASAQLCYFDESDRQAAVKQASKRLQLDEKSFPARTLSGMISSAKTA